ncbi:MAG: hypothetical protein M3R01_05740, partial [Actinomycetota bacterium]|nr:hypothetical protein [Actinomycetota bacterium]
MTGPLVAEVVPGESGRSVTARLTLDAGVEVITFRALGSGPPLGANEDAMVTMALLPAMRMGRRLQVQGEISPTLLGRTAEIEAYFHGWDPNYQVIDVEAQRRRTAVGPAPPGLLTASFFTGGVDSLFTVLAGEQEVDELVYVHGFDVPLGNTTLRKTVSESIRRTAHELGKPLVEVETDLRSFSDGVLSWGVYHGA